MIRVGVGGFVFAPWRGVFYPHDLPRSRELAYASRHLTSIEINGTFYRTQDPASFRRWYGDTPEDFVFSMRRRRRAASVAGKVPMMADWCQASRGSCSPENDRANQVVGPLAFSAHPVADKPRG
jgi:hypothetical protein